MNFLGVKILITFILLYLLSFMCLNKSLFPHRMDIVKSFISAKDLINLSLDKILIVCLKKNANVLPFIKPNKSFIFKSYTSQIKKESSFTKTTLILPRTTNMQKRTMMSGRSVYTARAAFHCLTALTNNNVMDNTTKINKNVLMENLVTLSLDHQTGVIQHKNAFIKHLINHKFDGPVFYNFFNTKTQNTILTCVSGDTDSRVMNEFPVIQAYTKQFEPHITNIQANLDTQMSDFYAQKQTNQDFFVNIIGKALNNATKPDLIRPHDEKSGQGMFKHATRGTLGLLTYDAETERNVQVTSTPIEMKTLIDLHLDSVIRGLKHDNLYERDFYDNVMKHAKIILLNAGNNFSEQKQAHTKYQQFMWDNFHTNPKYPRSISFIFPIVVDYNHLAEQDIKFINFKHKFTSLLDDRLYDLNKRGDFQAISKALLIAYKDTVDPKIIEKLQHLKNTNLTFNAKFLEDMLSLMKHGL